MPSTHTSTTSISTHRTSSTWTHSPVIYLFHPPGLYSAWTHKQEREMCEGSIFHFRARRGESRDTIIIPEGERERAAGGDGSGQRGRKRRWRMKSGQTARKMRSRKRENGGWVTKKMKKGVNGTLISLSHLFQLSGLSESNSSQAEVWRIDLKISGNYKEALSGELTSFRGRLLPWHVWSVCIHLFLDTSLISTHTFMSRKSKNILLNASIKRVRLRISLQQH